MLRAMKDGKYQGELAWLNSHRPILWIRFFGFFVSGMSLGWLMRTLATSWSIGAMSVAIIVAMLSAICSQIGIAILPLLRRNHSRHN